MRKPIKTTLTISVAFIMVIRLRPIWERNPGGLWNALFFLVIVVLFFWIITKIVKELIRIFRNRKTLTLYTFIPLVILSLSLLDGFYNPMKVDLEGIYGQVTFRACYEGTQNQATFKLREGNEFELHWTGAFMYDEFFQGTYEKVGDTLVLNYRDNKPIRFGNQILMDNEDKYLVTIRTDNDSLRNVVRFYYGYCKGLN